MPGGAVLETQSELPAATFSTQANALLRKNLVFQRRRWKTSLLLVLFPGLLCVFLFTMQKIIDSENNKASNKCGCACVPRNDSSGACDTVCGVQYSTDRQALTCSVPSPPEVPAMLQVPDARYRAVNFEGKFPGFPDPRCRDSGSCDFVFLYTGGNRSLADATTSMLLPIPSPSCLLSCRYVMFFFSRLPSISLHCLGGQGTSRKVPFSYFLEDALTKNFSILLRDCTNAMGIPCVPTDMVWRDSKQLIEEDIYDGYRRANPESTNTRIHFHHVAYNFLDTSSQNLDLVVYYNSSYRGNVASNANSVLLRVARSMNIAASSFLKMLLGPSTQLPLAFMKEMPKQESKLLINFTLLLGPLFYMWVVQLLFPVILVSLVYEKERRLRMMMKMHGLGDGPYWFINYVYFLAFSILYILFLMIFGAAIGLDFFRQNSYSIQFVFYFVYMNLQIAMAFLGTALFSHALTATVCGYLYVFGSGLLGSFLMENYIEDTNISRKIIFATEILPGFALHRGLYEFSQYALLGSSAGEKGMEWRDLADHDNGLRQVLAIMLVEWIIFLVLAQYLDKVVASGCGLKRRPLFFLERFFQKSATVASDTDDISRPDVANERAIVETLRTASNSSFAIICDDLKKIYAGKDGNPDNYAVRSLSLAIRRGECFGMLGPNGAGKTTSINMMIGFLTPSSGKAFVAGLDISKDMDKIYTVMGVCPQHDLLWGSLTGREHLLFYGRLKNLKGAALDSAVETSLKNVNLFYDGVGDRRAGTYSGGMKRRLSVAISLIGHSKAVYMDEPSTGLDPASRRTLWNAIKKAKQDRAIILTTHSMEEAEALCDRVGIFVKGQLQCIGNTRELKSRYGGTYVFTVTGDPSKEQEVGNLVREWSSGAKQVYNLSGTQKFEIPKDDVKIARVFREVGEWKERLGIQAWGLTDTTLEDVFIKVATN
ncbi:ATP-binding cassette transporter [Selaginella moellendorffii]|uniref:ATP-binding cassette transporter n=1 Tax=Selaginella moellendorffii TaxID=88036 RepID=D8RFW2_SELML|nr:ATP-binding cassette transporter [Selaginella moellendorffii]